MGVYVHLASVMYLYSISEYSFCIFVLYFLVYELVVFTFKKKIIVKKERKKKSSIRNLVLLPKEHLKNEMKE